MSQLYVIENFDGTFNFMKVGSDLMFTLEQKELLDMFIDTYKSDYEHGIIDFLVKMGVSESSIYKNIEVLGGIPEDMKDLMLRECKDRKKDFTELYDITEPEILLN